MEEEEKNHELHDNIKDQELNYATFTPKIITKNFQIKHQKYDRLGNFY